MTPRGARWPLPRRERPTGCYALPLASRGYRVSVETRDGATYYHADRFRLFRFGTLLSHLGIVLLVVMIMWGALAGLTINNIVLEPGQSSLSAMAPG